MATIEDLYRQILGREPDAGGLAYWQQQQAAGMPFQEMQNAFLLSKEHANNRFNTPVTWDQMMQAINAAPLKSGDNQAYQDWVNVPGLGDVHVTRGNMPTHLAGGDNGPDPNNPAYQQWLRDWGDTGITGVQMTDPYRASYANGDGGLYHLNPGDKGSITGTAYDGSHNIPWGALAMMLGPFAAAMGGVAAAGGAAAGAGTAGGLTALPAGGMTATGALGAAPWATTAGGLGTLGTGTLGATTAGVGSAMGLTGGAFGLGTGLAGVTAADLAAAGIGSALTSGAGTAGTSASGGGESMLYDTNGMGLTGSGGIGAAPSVVEAGAGAAGYGTAGGGMLQTLLDKGLDFATSKLGSSLIGGLLGGSGSSKAGDQTITNRQEIDPRMAAILYGPNGNNGFINQQIMGLLDNPQAPGMSGIGQAADHFLGQNATWDFGSMRDASKRLMAGDTAAPTMQAAQVGNVPGMSPAQMQAAQMEAARINAPRQNNLGLTSAYEDMIFGAPGANPYLTGGIQRGINQSTNAFGDYLTDATKATQDLLGNIRGGAIVNGAMGGSRQGIAEGRAIGDLTQNLGRAATRFGQNNTDAAVTAQAGAYDADRNRALMATQGLGAQQYGVAGQQAGFDQQAKATNAGFDQQANFTNAGFQQDAARTNYAGDLQKAMQDAQFKQQASGNNLQSQLGTNQLNTNSVSNGLSGMSGLLGQVYGFGQDSDSYDANKVGKVSGLLGPYTGLGGTSTQTQPLYENKGANVLGGAMLGQQLAQGFGGWGNNVSPAALNNPYVFNSMYGSPF